MHNERASDSNRSGYRQQTVLPNGTERELAWSWDQARDDMLAATRECWLPDAGIDVAVARGV
jgi:hypothetical protein